MRKVVYSEFLAIRSPEDEKFYLPNGQIKDIDVFNDDDFDNVAYNENERN